jgi:hypothetical protein
MSLFVLLGLYQQTPPAARAVETPASDFSSRRALKHLEVIAAEPRPAGSAAHERVRNYLLGELSSLGLDAQVQEALALSPRGTPLYAVARVRNVVGLLRGSEPGKALMLAAHYDSVSTSFGASDDGAAVAAILETIRALKAGAPLKRDLVVLFTDAEEEGLLGARAFVDEHPLARNVGLVLNFEARGNTGPSYMFETSGDNSRLVEEFSKAAPDPEASSLAYEIYRRLPNDTDFTVFKGGGLPGLNFAFIGGLTHYHTRLDMPANLDERSLQHHGDYALSLARHFGNLSLEPGGRGEAVYFKPFKGLFVHYGSAWVLPLALLVTALFLLVVVVGFRRKLLTIRGVIFGFLAQLLVAAVAWGAVTLVWWALRAALGGSWIYDAHLFAIAFVFLTLTVFFGLNSLFGKMTGRHNLAVGALLWWLILLLGVSLYVPGASYLFVWPLLFVLVGLAALLLLTDDGRVAPAWLYLVLLLCAVPALFLWSQTLYQIYQAMTLSIVGPLMVVVALVCGLLLPQFGLFSGLPRWSLTAAAALLCLAFVVVGVASSDFDKESPKMNSIFYVMNGDTGQAVWASIDETRDEWTRQYLADNAAQGPLAAYLPLSYRGFTTSPAPAASLDAPEAALLEDMTTDGARTLRLRIRSRRQAPFVTVDVEPGTEIRRALLDGKPLGGTTPATPQGASVPWGFRYFAMDDRGVELTLETVPARPLKIRVADRTAGLPELPGVRFTPRPEHMMPAPYPYDSTTSISKSFNF